MARGANEPEEDIVTTPIENTVRAAGAELAVIRGGSGKPLLILHDELGYPGWMTWNEKLAQDRTLLIPLQPGFGKTPRIDWIRTIAIWPASTRRSFASWTLEPIDVIGFSAGGFIAAEMVAADPQIFSRMVLVAPMGIKAGGRRDHGYFRGDDAPSSAGDRRRSRQHPGIYAKIYGGR